MPTKVNILIPTRNRADTLVWSLRTALNQSYPNLQVIVSDNVSTDHTRAVVEGIGDPRVRYVNPGRSLSMSHHYEFLLDQVEEGWIVQIGDDDGLVAESIGWVVEALEESGLEAMASKQCSYTWPTAPEPPLSRLSVPLGRSIVRKSSAKAVREGVLMQQRTHMPQVYTGGVVHFDLIKRIKAKTGSFYRAQIPDYYSGMAIGSSTTEYLFSNRPFAIAGRSSHSIGHSLFARRPTQFLEDDLIPFHASLLPMPPCGTLMFSLPAIWVECYLKTADLHGDPLKLSSADILLLVLRESFTGMSELEAWGREFARRNGLDYEATARRAKHQRLGAKLATKRAMISNLFERYRISWSGELAVNNVYDASVAADLIWHTRPSRVRNYIATWRNRHVTAPGSTQLPLSASD